MLKRTIKKDDKNKAVKIKKNVALRRIMLKVVFMTYWMTLKMNIIWLNQLQKESKGLFVGRRFLKIFPMFPFTMYFFIMKIV